MTPSQRRTIASSQDGGKDDAVKNFKFELWNFKKAGRYNFSIALQSVQMKDIDACHQVRMLPTRSEESVASSG